MIGSSPRAWGTRCFGSPTRQLNAVHPHVRGEHPSNCTGFLPTYGSSPRAWGTLITLRKLVDHRRFIPTCVGNTLALRAVVEIISVHPHVRGEHHVFELIVLIDDGSSPRAWGTRPTGHASARWRRFIPTCVGNTRKHPKQTFVYAVHPHVRGEHSGGCDEVAGLGGSSPRAWGTLRRGQKTFLQHWFIPTCVGNTVQSRIVAPMPTVHPHVRGEHIRIGLQTMHDGGSSPRAWGTQHCEFALCDQSRFIPTCVGNTMTCKPASDTGAVHPHVRGEHVQWYLSGDIENGSSPRAWGTLALPDILDHALRFIPTCVGNTTPRRIMTAARSVHPHVRGEHQDFSLTPTNTGGSSPRAWGTRNQPVRGELTRIMHGGLADVAQAVEIA